MEKYTAKQARESFSDVIANASVGRKRVVITKNGRDVAAVVPISDLELLAEIERFCDLSEAVAALKEAEFSRNNLFG